MVLHPCWAQRHLNRILHEVLLSWFSYFLMPKSLVTSKIFLLFSLVMVMLTFLELLVSCSFDDVHLPTATFYTKLFLRLYTPSFHFLKAFPMVLFVLWTLLTLRHNTTSSDKAALISWILLVVALEISVAFWFSKTFIDAIIWLSELLFGLHFEGQSIKAWM